MRSFSHKRGERRRETFPVFIVEQFLRIVENQGHQPAALFQHVLPECKKECDEAGAQSGGVGYMLRWCRHAARLHNKVQLALAAHAGVDQLMGSVRKRAKINPGTPRSRVVAQGLAKLIDLLVGKLPQAGEASQGCARDGVFAKPRFGGPARFQMLLEPATLDECIGDRLGGFYRGFEIDQLSG